MGTRADPEASDIGMAQEAHTIQKGVTEDFGKVQ